MSLFKKPKKNLRQRIAADEEEEQEGNHAPSLKVEINPTPTATSGNNKPSTKPPKVVEIRKKTSILSFQEDLEEDEGIETFQIKKSSQSRRIAKRMERDRKLKEQEQKTQLSAKATTVTVQDEKQAETNQESSTPETPKNLILSGREAEMAGYRSDSEEESADEGIKFRRPDPFRNVLESRARYLFNHCWG